MTSRLSALDYNFERFTRAELIRDVQRTWHASGIAAGEMAPDLELPRAGGGSIRLSDMRGRAVLLHFGSYT